MIRGKLCDIEAKDRSTAGAGKIVGIVRSSGGRFELVENVQDLIFVDLNFLPDFD